MKIKLKKLMENAKLPSAGSIKAAGYDLYSCLEEQVTILPHETKMIGTGLAVAIPEGYFGGIFARSGLAAKQGLRPANCVGVVDADYRGEIKVALHNDTEQPRTIKRRRAHCPAGGDALPFAGIRRSRRAGRDRARRRRIWTYGYRLGNTSGVS